MSYVRVSEEDSLRLVSFGLRRPCRKELPREQLASIGLTHRMFIYPILPDSCRRMNGNLIWRRQRNASFQIGHRFEEAVDGLGLMVRIDLNSQHGERNGTAGKVTDWT